jgi:thiamine pyrophosphokinase
MIFDRKIKFDVAICLNGEIFNDDIEYIQNANIPIIACDGAANKIFPVIPNYIIGDMDSIDSNIISSRTTIITDKNQDKFDFEKAIDFAINQKFLKVVVLGSNGGVLEHTLNNLSILQRYAFSKNIFLSPLTNNRIGFFIENDVTFQSFKSEIVSIIPISKVKITSSGLK